MRLVSLHPLFPRTTVYSRGVRALSTKTHGEVYSGNANLKYDKREKASVLQLANLHSTIKLTVIRYVEYGGHVMC